ncbi:MAG: hypothetical protein K8I30_15955, partial [Anaerolineae bacterium]|nr:hypothetical protein [Anaerolineae bacterium]
MVQPLHIKNAYVWDGRESAQRDLYTSADGRIIDQPASGAQAVDLDGYSIYPGLINAHDHLELNHYPRTKFREIYDNAHQWGEDVNARLNDEPFKSLRAYPLADRLFIGGLKNLLCGATTVVHHGPPHKPMFRRDFPVRVLRRYGWAHSLHFNTDEEVVRSYRSTPPDVPWFIHLAEGTDDVAAGEYQRLKALGCVGKNTVIVHGVGLTDEDIDDAAQRVRALVWCPTTNYYLLGATAAVYKWREAGGIIAVGSDSRLTAQNDFLTETVPEDFEKYDGSAQIWKTLEFVIDEMWHNGQVTIGATHTGHLDSGGVADWFIEPDLESYRNNLPLVVQGGVPQIGDPEIMAKFPHVQTIPA